MTAQHDAALALAAAGYVVMPLGSLSNLPHRMLSRGWRYCTCGTIDDRPLIGSNDIDDIDAWWWTDANANVGVVCGARSRLLDIDVDMHSADGHVVFNAWRDERCREGLVLPDHPTYITPSGGRHHWFALPPGMHVKTNTWWLDNCEVKACGGEIAVPPSIRMREHVALGLDDQPVFSDEPTLYAWERLVDLPMAPVWLLNDVARRRDKPMPANGGGNGIDAPPTPWLREHGFVPGDRDACCYKLACRLWRRHWPDGDVVRSVVRAVWEATEQPRGMDPFPWSRAEIKIKQAYTWVSRQIGDQQQMAEDLEAGRRA